MRPHRDHRLDRLTAPQACVLSTLNALDGRIRWEDGRYRLAVPGAGFRSAYVVNEATVVSLLRRRLLELDRDRNGYVLSELGRKALSEKAGC